MKQTSIVESMSSKLKELTCQDLPSQEENDWEKKFAALKDFRLKNAKDCFAYNYPIKESFDNFDKQKFEKFNSDTVNGDKYSITPSDYIQFMKLYGLQPLMSSLENPNVYKETEKPLKNVLKKPLTSKSIPYVLRQRWLREKLLKPQLSFEGLKSFQIDDNSMYLNKSIALTYQPMERKANKLKGRTTQLTFTHIK